MPSIKTEILTMLTQATRPLSTGEVSFYTGMTEPTARSVLGQLLKAGVIRAEIKYVQCGERKDWRKYYFTGASK